MSGDRHNVSNLDTVKKQINYNELSKGELLDIIAYLQSELEARDVLISILKNEKGRSIYQQARYGHLPGRGADPFQALQRDSEISERGMGPLHASGPASSPSTEKNLSNVDALRPIYDSQLSQLENLIATQKRAQQKLRDQLTATEKAYRKVFMELEETRKSHERDTAQGDDVLVHLEKERERLTSELEHERVQRHKSEKELQRLRQLYDESQMVNELQTKVATKMICQYLSLHQNTIKASDITPTSTLKDSAPIKAPQELQLTNDYPENISISEASASPINMYISNRGSTHESARSSEKELALHNGIYDTRPPSEEIILEAPPDVRPDNEDDKRSPKVKTPMVSNMESAVDAISSIQYFVSKMSIPTHPDNTIHSPVDLTSSSHSQDSDNSLTSPAFFRNSRLKPEPPIRRTPEQSYLAKALISTPMATVITTTTPIYSTPTTVNFAALHSQSTSLQPQSGAPVIGSSYQPHRVLPQPHLILTTSTQSINTMSSSGAKSNASFVATTSSTESHQVVYATPRKILPQQPPSTLSSGVVGIIRPIQYSVSSGAGISNLTPQQHSVGTHQYTPISVTSHLSTPGGLNRLKLPSSASTSEDIVLNNGSSSSNILPNNLRKFPSHHHAVPVNSIRSPHLVAHGVSASPAPQHFMSGHSSVQLLASSSPSTGSPSIPQGGVYIYHQLPHNPPLPSGSSHSNAVASPAIPSTSQHR